MTINFQLTSEDFLTYQLYASSKSKTHQKRRQINRLVGPIAMLVYGVYLTNRDENIIGIVITTIASLLWVVFYPYYSGWRYKKHFAKHVKENYNNRINLPVEIHFDEENISSKDKTSESKINASELKELIETKMYFFISLTNDLTLIIPKHAVANTENFKNHILQYGVTYVDELNWVWK